MDSLRSLSYGQKLFNKFLNSYPELVNLYLQHKRMESIINTVNYIPNNNLIDNQNIINRRDITISNNFSNNPPLNTNINNYYFNNTLPSMRNNRFAFQIKSIEDKRRNMI